jgi:hypothetical protein
MWERERVAGAAREEGETNILSHPGFGKHFDER